ncbi:uncharacterized protein LOC116773534 [Danaus plexippus]|uniref:uncharacterized protein LOC116773534 n=1 Tax=Danaus plexippus TaxID=13037 RepID=UPI002AB001CE|nr:uncharacterized protein LOC116773534 [Danaus plexippus]
MYLAIILLTIISQNLINCNDIRLGYTMAYSKKIYGEIKEAEPALWRRSEDIVVNAPNDEVISAVYVTDLRDNKDGEAAILTGGIGAKSVTIELKSPSILRGYRFEVEVFSNNPNLRLQSKGYSAPLYDGQYARKF